MNTETRRFRNGDKVRLDAAKIMGYKDYNTYLRGYQAFVENAGDRVYTVRRDGRLYTFEEIEEKNGVRWLFWPEDLILVKAADD